MREIRPSGSKSGVWKRSTAAAFRHRQPKGSGTAYAEPKPPRHTSTLLVRERHRTLEARQRRFAAAARLFLVPFPPDPLYLFSVPGVVRRPAAGPARHPACACSRSRSASAVGSLRPSRWSALVLPAAPPARSRGRASLDAPCPLRRHRPAIAEKNRKDALALRTEWVYSIPAARNVRAASLVPQGDPERRS